MMLTAGVNKIADKVDLQFSYDYNRARALYEYIAGAVPNRTLPEETVITTTLPPPTALPMVKSDLGRGTVDLMYALRRTRHRRVLVVRAVSSDRLHARCRSEPRARPRTGGAARLSLSPVHGEHRLGPDGLPLVAAPAMRRLVVQLVSHPISAVGGVLAAASGLCFSALSCHPPPWLSWHSVRDIVVFVMLPTLFALGFCSCRSASGCGAGGPEPQVVSEVAWPKLDLNVPETRRALLFVTAATFVGLVALSFASQRAVEYSESQQFCGQTCHQPMGPHFTAHQSGLHSRVIAWSAMSSRARRDF